MLDKKRSHKGAIIGGAVSIAILVFAVWIGLNRQYVADQVSVWAYKPSSDIKAIEGRVDFTGKGKFYFYATQPRVASAQEFNSGCPRQETGSPILGCYDNNGRIFIYDITNKKLNGMEEVTAAHEMLHAVWGRMNQDERRKTATLLRAYYEKQGSKELVERMGYYQRNEPGEFENELHSILGTEVTNLGSELESYYAQFFEDRQQVLDLHDKYDSVFRDLKTRADALYDTLVSLGPDINKRSAQYNKDVSKLAKDIKSFNARASSGDFASMAQFNTERSALIARSNQLEANRQAISTDIETYNAKYNDYQLIGAELEILSDSIDSIKVLQPTPSVQ